jgi:hypothetical protein
MSLARPDFNLAEQRKAVQSAIEYAKSIDDWLNQMPQPEHQTAERTFDEVLGDVVGELARIRACYSLKEVVQRVSAAAAATDDPAAGQEAVEAQRGLSEAMDLLRCPKV